MVVTSCEEVTMESDTSRAGPSTPGEEPAQAESSQTSGPLTAEERAAKRTQLFIIGGAVGFLLILAAAIFLMARFPTATQVVRDIAIVFVAVETFLIGLAMILLLFQIQVLIQVLRDEIQPLLHSVNDTASTVRGTTEFMSHNLVSPIIKFAGFTSGVRRVVSDTIGVARGMRPRSRSVKPTSTGTNGGNHNVQSGE
jgi:hypothetical protein